MQQIFDLLWKTKDKAIVERFGLWLLQRDRALGLKVGGSILPSTRLLTLLSSLQQLFSDPKQTLTFETRDLFGKIRAVDGDAADQFLEGAVLQERDTVSSDLSDFNEVSLTVASRRRTRDCTPTSSSGTSIDWRNYWATLQQNHTYVTKVSALPSFLRPSRADSFHHSQNPTTLPSSPPHPHLRHPFSPSLPLATPPTHPMHSSIACASKPSSSSAPRRSTTSPR